MAIVQIRHDTPGRDYYRRKLAAGKTPMEALRCLKRRLSDVVFRQLLADADRPQEAGPGGHSGATLKSSAASPTPAADSSDKSLPGPATGNATAPAHHRQSPRLDIEGSHERAFARPTAESRVPRTAEADPDF